MEKEIEELPEEIPSEKYIVLYSSGNNQLLKMQKIYHSLKLTFITITPSNIYYHCLEWQLAMDPSGDFLI